MISRREFAMRLKKLGFRRVHPNDREVLMYERYDTDVNRILDVQLWSDGKHRMSHWRCKADGSKASMSTTPVAFNSCKMLDACIEHERTRTDYEHHRPTLR